MAQSRLHAANVRGMSYGCGDLETWTRLSPTALDLVTAAIAAPPNSEHIVAQSEVRKACGELGMALIELPGVITSLTTTALSRSKRTVLHRAAANGFRDAVTLILEAGADPSLKDINSRSPAHVAAAAGFINVTQDLLSRAPVSLSKAKDKFGWSVDALLTMLDAETHVPHKLKANTRKHYKDAEVTGGWDPYIATELEAPFLDTGRCDISEIDAKDLLAREDAGVHDLFTNYLAAGQPVVVRGWSTAQGWSMHRFPFHLSHPPPLPLPRFLAQTHTHTYTHAHTGPGRKH